MNLSDLFAPWLMLAGVLIPLIYVEKWIHSHLYGIGWVITNDKKSATALYYVLLLPGVFVHEFTQYLVAGALNVRIKRVIAWPEAQDDGTLRLNFVQIQKAMWFQAAIIGAAPFIVGLSLVWVISNHILNLEQVLQALSTADVTVIGPALQKLGSTPDFYLWLYLMFAISNAMFPTPADREGWPLVILLFSAVLVFLVLIGVGDVLLETFTGPVAHGVELLATAFATVLAVEVPSVLVISFIEEILERVTKRKFEYSQRVSQNRRRQPGSSEPLPAGTPLPSIYNLDLPIPLPTAADRRTPSRKSASPSPEKPPAPAVPLRQPVREKEPERLSRSGSSAPRHGSRVQDSPPPLPTAPPRETTAAAAGRTSAGPRPARTDSPHRPMESSRTPPQSPERLRPGMDRSATPGGPAPRPAPTPRKRSPFARPDRPSARPFTDEEPEVVDGDLSYEDFDPADGVMDNIYDGE